MESFLPAMLRTNQGAPAKSSIPRKKYHLSQFVARGGSSAAMRKKIVSLTLAGLLLVPHVLAGKSAPPTVKFAVAPKYPALTLEGRVYGVVMVRVTIDSTGAVKDAKVVEGHPMLTEAAADAARQWKFQESSNQKRVATLKFSFVILPSNSEVSSQTIFLPPMGIEIRQRPAEPAVEDEEGDFTLMADPISRT